MPNLLDSADDSLDNGPYTGSGTVLTAPNLAKPPNAGSELGKPGVAHRKIFAADWADNFVAYAQNPLQQAVAAIIDPLTAAKKAGTLTYQQLADAYDQYKDVIAQFEDRAAFEETQGSRAAQVVKQGRATLAPIIQSWNDNFQTDLTAYKPAEPSLQDQVKPPTLDTTASANTAAVQQKKRALAAPGRSATILGGTLNPAGYTLARPTILGY